MIAFGGKVLMAYFLKHTVQKSSLKGAEWRLFQFRSIFQCGVKRLQNMAHANVQAW